MWRMGFLAVLFLAAGCSPEYNWREVAVADGAVQAVFPDRAEAATKKLVFDGHEVPFTITAAEAGKTVFAVGYAPWPQALKSDPQTRRRMGRAVVESFYRSLDVAPPDPLPAFGETFQVSGQDGHTILRARVWLLPQALVEGIVAGPGQAFPDQPAKDFLRSVQAGAR